MTATTTSSFLPRFEGAAAQQPLWTVCKPFSMKMGDAYRTRKNPTPEAILQTVYGNRREEWEYRGPAKKYLEAGGTVEDALDAICKMAKIAIGDGEFDEDGGENA